MLEQSSLLCNQTPHLALDYSVRWAKFTNEQGRGRDVPGDLACHRSGVEISIAVQTAIATSIVGTKINACYAAAFGPLIGVLANQKVLPDDLGD